MFNIIICNNYDEVSNEAFKVLKEVVSKNEKPVLGLATGSSPIGLYKKMQADHKKGYSYKNCITFNLDEYVGLDRSHDQSYWTFMNENLFSYLDIEEKNINIPVGNADDLNQACIDYENKLNEYSVDVQILGIGSNGHIGFNEPGTPFDSTTHIVDLKEQTRKDNARFFDSIDDVPTQAVSMGIASILRSKKLVVIATGENKAEAVYKMIKGPINIDLPASVLQKHNDVVVILDKEAASKL